MCICCVRLTRHDYVGHGQSPAGMEVVVVRQDDWSHGWHLTLLLLKVFDMSSGRGAFEYVDVAAHLNDAEL
jgi:hypothetical protein